MPDCGTSPQLDRLTEIASIRNMPLQALYELTGRCNLDCGHCYLDIHHPPPELSTAEALGVVDQLADAGTLFLTLSGGEVFLRSDAIEIARHARRRGLAVRFFTNGTRIDRALAREIASVHPLSVEISIYGTHSDAHDRITRRRRSLRKSLRGALLLQREGVPVGLKAPLLDVVAPELDELFALGRRMGMPTAFDPFIIPRLDGNLAPRALNSATEALAEALKHPDMGWAGAGGLPPPQGGDEPPCAIGRSACKIDASGNLFPCSTYPVPIGNVRERSVAEMWRGGALLDRLRAIRIRDLQSDCAGCEQSGYCTRCMAVALIEHGNELGPAAEACRLAAAKEAALGLPVTERPLPAGRTARAGLVQLGLPRERRVAGG